VKGTKGTLCVRVHSIELQDSAVLLARKDAGSVEHLVGWDWNLGRDPERKRALIVRADSALGADISGRYSAIWDRSRVILEWSAGECKVNKLEDVKRQALAAIERGNGGAESAGTPSG
jgi:hypothetical protein